MTSSLLILIIKHFFFCVMRSKALDGALGRVQIWNLLAQSGHSVEYGGLQTPSSKAQ